MIIKDSGGLGGNDGSDSFDDGFKSDSFDDGFKSDSFKSAGSISFESKEFLMEKPFGHYDYHIKSNKYYPEEIYGGYPKKKVNLCSIINNPVLSPTITIPKPVPAQNEEGGVDVKKESGKTEDSESSKESKTKWSEWSGFSALKSGVAQKADLVSEFVHDIGNAVMEAREKAAVDAERKAKEKFERLSIMPPTHARRVAVKPIVDDFIFDFGTGGAGELNLLGAKGALLGEMVRLGLPVPEGFTISTEGREIFMKDYESVSKSVLQAIKRVGQRSGFTLGDAKHPLLMSVRSGATVSMPGIMDTILNVGVNEKMSLKNPFLRKCYERLLVGFGRNVYGIERFNESSHYYKDNMTMNLESRIARWKWSFSEYGMSLPEDLEEQFHLAIKAVFSSWDHEKAVQFRKEMGIPDSAGTAVNVQRMVYGNTGPTSLTAAFFTRDSGTGKDELSGSFIRNEQGDTLVGGGSAQLLSQLEPEMRDKLQFIADMLEAKFKDMQEIEVTVERGVPYVLQTRTGKRTARAALKIITDLVKAGKISEEEALLRMKPSDIELLSTGEACPDPAKNLLIGEGTPVSPGVICGSVVFSSEYAEKYKKLGVKPILVKRNLDTSDIRCIKQSDGILIADGIGNNVSHAITVARSLNKAIVTGAPLRFDYENVRLNSRRLRSGDEITLDANTGRVYLGHTNIIEHKPGEELETLLGIADNLVSRGIIVSVSTPEDAKLVSKDHSIFFSPMGCLTPEQIGYLRGLIYGDKKDPDEIRKKLTHDYSAFIESAGNDRSLLVLGVIPEQNLRAVVPSRIRLESRLEFQRDYYEKLRLRDSLVLVGTKGIELKDGKIIGVNNGDELIYDGRKVRVNKICAGCGIELMFEDGGRTCVKIRDLSQIKGIDPNSQIESYVSPESLAAKDVLTSLEEEHLRLEKANPHLVYTLQLEAATDAVKNHPGSPVIIGKASPYQRTTEVDGEIYDLIPIRDLNRRRLERAQEVLNNGR